jgi:hypothetical protein
LISRRLVAIGLLQGARLWACGWWVAIRLNILLSRSRLTSTVRLLLLHGVWSCGRWRGTRSRSGARGNYGGDGFALRDCLGCGDDGGLAAIDGGKLLTVLRGLFAMLNLGGHRRNALLARGGELRWSRLASDAAWSVVADAGGSVIDSGVVNRGVGYGAVVDLDVAAVHVVDGTVIVEAISAPVSALVTGSGVAISIINTTVIADVRAPITVVVPIAMAVVSPPSGCPQITGFGWAGPCAGNPVIAF